MTTKKVPQPPRKRGLVIQVAASEEEALARERAAVEKQKQWARDTADRIERGELPSANDERQVIALILRHWADTPRPKKPAKRGNPKFERKVYSADNVALEVGFQIAFGKDPQPAIAHVADAYNVDVSTIAKIFRERREAVARWFTNSNLSHRVGAILGE